MTAPSNLSGPELIELRDRVVQLFGLTEWRDLGAILDMADAVETHPRLLRSLNFRDDDYPSHALHMLRTMINAKPGNLDLLTDYLHRKGSKDGEFVSSEDIGARRIVFSPSVFRVPDERPDINLLSVMMSFDSSLDPVYRTIKSAAETIGLKCMRADDIWDSSTVIQDVFSLIFRSYIVVCDFSGRNPNVFYEAGIAHTLGKHVVPITQTLEHIPFDLRHHRAAVYLNNGEGLQSLQGDLVDRFRILVARQVSVSST